jgi:FlaA1/EpsC-like NDP-sugar epimerase
VITLSLSIAVWIRFEFSLRSLESSLLMTGLTLILPIKMVVFSVGSLQRDWWRYAGLSDLVRIFLVNSAASGLSALGLYLWIGPGFPRSIYVIDFLLCFLFSAGARFSVRIYNETLRMEFSTNKKAILIYGAGAAGRTLLREVRTNSSLGFQVIGFVDDSQLLQFARIMDVPVLGEGRAIPSIVERYRNRGLKIDEVIIAMPSATGRQMREAHANCRTAGTPCRTIPGFADLLNGKYLSGQIRNISLEDLLGREQIRLDERRIQEDIAGKAIMVTGAAGSIGSELCRQAASFGPAKLVLFDQAESELFKIDQELRQKHFSAEIIPIVGDIRDFRCVEDVIRTHGIHSVYHAAAYKHVPMMETHVLEAVRNNVIGTWNVVKAAHKCQVGKFLMISSDKAVNPTSVMGLTKRIAELIVAGWNGRDGGTRFVSVRFGNVLGSNGSVVPTFQAQIAAGGPVTVTHADMRRYFMSIREAVQLVLQASTMGEGEEIFVLDMGEPVRILDLAHNMIQLAGLTPGEDIEIQITGLRPGEKLFEETNLEGESMLPTYHEKIRIFQGEKVESDAIASWLNRLQLLIARREVARILDHLAALVPEYKMQKSPERWKAATEETVVGPNDDESSASGRTQSAVGLK